jgi:hypothetical protein
MKMKPDSRQRGLARAHLGWGNALRVALPAAGSYSRTHYIHVLRSDLLVLGQLQLSPLPQLVVCAGTLGMNVRCSRWSLVRQPRLGAEHHLSRAKAQRREVP